jgi:hypothetical protein
MSDRCRRVRPVHTEGFVGVGGLFNLTQSGTNKMAQNGATLVDADLPGLVEAVGAALLK